MALACFHWFFLDISGNFLFVPAEREPPQPGDVAIKSVPPASTCRADDAREQCRWLSWLVLEL